MNCTTSALLLCPINTPVHNTSGLNQWGTPVKYTISATVYETSGLNQWCNSGIQHQLSKLVVDTSGHKGMDYIYSLHWCCNSGIHHWSNSADYILVHQ